MQIDKGVGNGVWFEVIAIQSGVETMTYQGDSLEEAVSCAREDSKRWTVEVRAYDQIPDWEGADWDGCPYRVIDFREE